VPEVLTSGHHANINKWQRERAIERTYERRPELLENADLTKKEKLFLEELKNK
jgi:tRNA (guanine37-N1)-methyltransferase